MYYNICKVINTKEIQNEKYAITYGMKIVDYANSREEAQQMVKLQMIKCRGKIK